ncbi:MAG: macro domain-containing protein [Anaerolineaceae bacterium]|jgi:O-acetyl-ADP-ribose deacetylase (regulator of RNase III)|nr:MAG: macro domain-containing protein [Anaerolineaceae bacterium]
MGTQSNVYFECCFYESNHLQLVRGDLTREKVDAIVNAANSHLQHGGGVAGAISRAGGSAIQEESDAWIRKHGPITHARPAFTHAGNLDCQYVIHAVGPVWGEGDEELKLRETIRGCFILAEELAITSLAFPAISTGIYGFPCGKAAQVFKEELFRFFEKNPMTNLHLVRLVLFDPGTLQIFLKEFEKTG